MNIRWIAKTMLVAGAVMGAQAAIAGPACCPPPATENKTVNMVEHANRDKAGHQAGVKAVTQDAENDVHDAKTAKLTQQVNCPIMDGNPINKKLYVDHGAQRIHVCCPPCLEGVKADPAAAVAKLAANGEAPGQALCPIMGRTIDPGQFVDHDGQRIYVCCAGCIRRVKANPEAALTKLRAQGVVTDRAGAQPATDGPDARKHQHH